MAEEMNRNILDPAVAEMKRLNALNIQAERDKFYAMPWYARLVPPNFEGAALGSTAAAFALWAEKVGQNRPWDHKPIIVKKFGARWYKQGKSEYYFDIWSNLHYGYAGMAAGFTEDVLMDGAGLEQVGSDTYRKLTEWDKHPGPNRAEGVTGLRAWDDASDRISIKIEIDMYVRSPHAAITGEELMGEVLKIGNEWATAIQKHKCE